MLMHPPRPARERRQNHQLRQLFEPAGNLLKPFVDPANSWGKITLDFLARQVLLEHYPHMNQRDAQTLITVYRQQTLAGQN